MVNAWSLAAPLNALQGPDAAQDMKRAARELRSAVTPLQYCFLALVTQVLRIESGGLTILQELGVWDLVYGPAFFYVGSPGYQGPAAVCLQEDYIGGATRTASAPAAFPAPSPIMGGGPVPAPGSTVPTNAGEAGAATSTVPRASQAVPGGRTPAVYGTDHAASREAAGAREPAAGPGLPGQAQRGTMLLNAGEGERDQAVQRSGDVGGSVEEAREAVLEVDLQRQQAVAELRKRVVAFTVFAAAVPSSGGPRTEVVKVQS